MLSVRILNLALRDPKLSRSFPGVPTITCADTLLTGVSLTTRVVVMFASDAYAETVFSILPANSWVGATITACGTFFPVSIRWSTVRVKVTVFPVPEGASAIMFLPVKLIGSVFAWMGDGLLKLDVYTAFRSSGFIWRSSNDFTSAIPAGLPSLCLIYTSASSCTASSSPPRSRAMRAARSSFSTAFSTWFSSSAAASALPLSSAPSSLGAAAAASASFPVDVEPVSCTTVFSPESLMAVFSSKAFDNSSISFC
mmetsp:Transcript_20362/g.57350  ORF Transcript_20362/g.57350 Transcript_20362/m.57350 type:complete len:254 (-) Transcript_20362:89-850(-)